jgi:hypothetical protein
VGDGSPGSRDAEGEGGEGFYIAQSGRCPDLLVIKGAELGRRRLDVALAVLAGERRRRRSPLLGEPQVSRGDPLTHAHPLVRSRR